MSNLNRYRGNFVYGTFNSFGSTDTVLSGTIFPTNTSIPSGYYLPIIINPGYFGTNNLPEIVYVSNISSSTPPNYTFTIVTGIGFSGTGRGLESTTPTVGVSGTPWVAGPLVSDFSLTSQFFNGDFPSPTSSGQLFVSTPVTASGGVTSSGSAINTFLCQFVSSLPTNFIINPFINLSGTLNSYTTVPNGNIAYTVNQQTGSTYTATSSDASSIILMTYSGASTITLPATGFTTSQQLTILRDENSGVVTISGAANTDVFSGGFVSKTPQLRTTGSLATAIYLGTTVSGVARWAVVGDLS